jgi:lysophospholipase L1-like esterase
MSQSALAQAARDILQAAFGWSAQVCQLQFDGKPPPIAGELFIAVHPGRWAGIDCEGLGEAIDFQVTVTKRASFAPDDEGMMQVWAAPAVGVDAICRAIIAKLHLDVSGDALIAAANAYIVAQNFGSPVNGFTVCPRFRDGGNPIDRGAEWFSAEGDMAVGKFANAGISQTISFGPAERYQTIESMQGGPLAPTGLITAVGDTSVAIGWTLPAALLTAVKVYRGTASDKETLLATLPASATSYVDTAVVPGTTYFYYVTASNAMAESYPSAEVSATPSYPLYVSGLVEWWDPAQGAYQDAGATIPATFGQTSLSWKGRMGNVATAIATGGYTTYWTGGGYDGGSGPGFYLSNEAEFVVNEFTTALTIDTPYTLVTVSTDGLVAFSYKPYVANGTGGATYSQIATNGYSGADTFAAFAGTGSLANVPTTAPLQLRHVTVLSVPASGGPVKCYFDGADVSSGLTTSGNWGALTFGGAQYTAGDVLIYNRALTPSEAASLTAYLKGTAVSLVCEGNSQTVGFGLTNGFQAFPQHCGDVTAAAGGRIRTYAKGVVGRPMSGTYSGTTQLAAAPTEVDPLLDPTAIINIAFSHETTNNIAVGGRTGLQDLSDNLAWATARTAANWPIVALSTCPDRNTNGPTDVTNAQIRISNAGLLALCTATTIPYLYKANAGQPFQWALDIFGLLGPNTPTSPNFVADHLHYSLAGNQLFGQLLAALVAILV